jgi:hypothetical protein
MTRRRYVQMPDGKLVDKDSFTEPPLAIDSGALWGDEGYRGQRATDGTMIDTRTKHRDYMKQRGLTTIDDYTDHFAQAEKARERHYRGEDPQRVQDIIRAIESRR